MTKEEIKPGYVRVTDILHPFSGFDDAPEYVKERAKEKAVIGNEVHDAIHMYYECIPYGLLSDEAQPYFDSFLLWDSGNNPTPKMLEKRYYDDTLKITGQVDALMNFKGGDDLVMIDWKTSSSWNSKMETSWLLQGTFYHYLLEYNSIPNVGDIFLFIQLDPHGKLPRVREFTYRAEEMGNCMAALQIYRRFNPLKGGK